jgi:uncharacterized protein (TIGR03435 family)
MRSLSLCQRRFFNLTGIAVMMLTIAFGLAGTNWAGAQTTSQTPAAKPIQDIADNWQGTLHVGKDLRVVIKISKADGGGYKAVFYSIDQSGQGLPISKITLEGTAVKLTTNVGISYEGKLSADGKSIVGNFIQGSTFPLTLTRATAETEWAIPEPPPVIPPMAANTDPNFEVATIKPNSSGAPSLQALVIDGRNFQTRNSSLGDLIVFAYNVQVKQIVSGPDWLDKDRYDIAAVPEQEGTPNVEQLRIMVRKLLADRFKLTFHHDKRELSAYVLTVAKSGNKLTPTERPGPLPGFWPSPGPGGVTLNSVNTSMLDFAGFMQELVLDRPVVDQTGITGRFDFHCTFTPDDSQFGGHSPIPPQTDAANSAPGLYEALQQQLGLKLSAEKTAVDVLVLDHVEKPSAN